ncbi:cupin-like domain-containing protein [Amycolatopsis sp. QT-25]|uniref:cupin-like domain-containing protein n=1 Tax=Amycolatopsis sp. QT-25 TaxID=3034022 RepID=UPI0023EDABCD|nr:cupin-like domain-containing protein [Amycolatopsis sp. QT-25]WET76262.1 cupin-like domain-containing protein [Amycolatopsis sp. QT-25]
MAEAEPDPLEVTLRASGLTVRPVPRLGRPSAGEIEELITRRRRPAILTGMIEDWPARTDWTPQKLIERHGGKTVTALMDLPADGVLMPDRQSAYERTLTFASFVETMLTTTTAKPCYLAYTRVADILPSADYDFATLLGRADDDTGDTRAWIGSAGTRSMFHSDLKDNLFCQIWGRKHVVLLPWEHSMAAYPFPDNLVNSQVDLAEVDLGRFPRLREAPLLAATMNPGDVLFMPRGCWHDIRSRSPSISINHWFGEPMGFADYAGLLTRLGPRYWSATLRDFFRYGVLGRPQRADFFFTPAPTGKRLYDLVRHGNFSKDNDPADR